MKRRFFSGNGVHYRYDNLRILIIGILLLFFVVCTLFPFFWLFTASIKPDEYIVSRQFYFLPPKITFEHYTVVFTLANIGVHFVNTVIVAAITVVLSLAAIIPASYALSVLKVKGRFFISRFILALQMLPAILLAVPLYIILQRIRLIDTYWALVLSYTTFTIPFCFLLLSSYFAALPSELFESAYLDGANSLYSMMRIAIPLTTPGIITTGTYSFLMGWNDFLYANTFTSSANVRTLCVEVIRLVGTWGNRWGNLAAGATVTVLPVIIIFLLANKYIISGLTAGAVKG
ncbi:MAG: carbohydrate ABC transporter permease [Treponema sp.]|jgi:ABC-type glycerol-3-phosphate transport system permease component|nr:carbohydrate ABC transporter permease [Treponema sp.]